MKITHMKNTDTREIVINKILAQIPPSMKPVDYISDILDIGKESAYRRLRGEMSFTLDEVIKLSVELRFSLDEIVGERNENRVYLDLFLDKDPEKNFMSTLQAYKNDVEIRLKYPSSDSIMATNYLPAIFCVHNPYLFKFAYYVWLHRKYKNSYRLQFSDVHISPVMESLRKRLDKLTRKIMNSTFILDPGVFLSPLRELRYFYRLRLISKTDIDLIKNDFHALIDMLEKMVRTGEFCSGSHFYVYLSDFNIDGNSSFKSYDDNMVSSFNFHFLSPIVVSNSILCELHKEWLESMKKYSILITQSNEMIQAKYFERQREYIDRIEDKEFYL